MSRATCARGGVVLRVLVEDLGEWAGARPPGWHLLRKSVEVIKEIRHDARDLQYDALDRLPSGALPPLAVAAPGNVARGVRNW